MSTAADRQAFLRLMGLTDADIADPDQQPGAMPHSQTSSSNYVTGKAQRGATYNSPTVSSVTGLSHSASLGGYSTRPSLMTTANTLRNTSLISASGPPSSSRTLFSTPRSVHWEEEHTATTSPASQPPQQVGTSGCTAGLAISEELKENGNCAFEAGAFCEAVQHYTSAINALAASPTHSDAEVMLLAALYSNRSAAYLQAAHELPSAEDAYARALCDADRTVALRLSWFKGYARQGDTYFKLKQYGAAAEAYEMALQLDPPNHILMNALAESRQRAKQVAREELELRRIMLSTTSTTPSLVPTMTGQSGESTRCEGDPRRDAAASQRVQTPHDVYDGGRRRSGQAQQLWAELKREVEATAHEVTGDAYRLQQLERFRVRNSKEATPTACQTAERNMYAKHAAVSSTGALGSAPMQGKSVAGRRVGAGPRLDANTGTAAAAAERCHVASASPFSAMVLSSEPQLPPRRRFSDSPTAGGIAAAMTTFNGPVQSARDVPYEFSSAAASAYQQHLLEVFRQRKAASK
ncbi:Tetratricopeptide repeat [Leishmania braziliensis]|nr:Tetratricopeptide repeat [Leishmania braziliensis]